MKQYSEVFPRSTVFVIGGGIGGLAAALALARAGHTVTLAEQAAEFGEVGAGLQLAPNATRILRDWGLLDAVVHAGVVTENLVARDAIDGSVLTVMPLGEAFLARYDAPYVVIHRTDLHQILLDACRASAGITLLTGTTIIDVQTEAQGATVTAEDGRRATYPVVIGADGLRSRTRDALVGDAPIPSGYVAYRGTIPSDGQASNDVTVWMGPGCHLVQYPLRQGTLLNNVVVFKSAGFARGDVEYGGVDELDTVFAGCAEPVQAALAHVGRQRRWPLYDRAPAPTWNDGRIVLTGDAAHPMLQYLAQGACQALEDADALARLAPGSKASEWDGAIAGFVAEREPRASRVQTTAHAFGDLCHAVGEQRLARNALLASRARDDFTVADWLWADRAPAHL
ncbi:FAD-dependent monooxygenase [Herbiconiux sp.]|uniref:FAD-dependent monooxygenase n=1 Tax=Herbiconiux sp. TaxID=1871186 RepID=UPI0025C354AC|nr:FAD-dependent monooxygenase [Herbiconiux sp.]